MEKKKRKLTVVVTKGEIAFVAYCPELGVTSQGKTEKVAIDNLKEATELYLEDEDVQEMLREHPLEHAKIATIAVKA